ncbi:hypothetical protein PPACK8108_LOCUS19741 [Phakopsora pachyrhizi]|uniref:Chromo domain-containing protein n=1 Tax=Phakopsora pachyrhizi TaxID=170000 RepID=A0AAV0BG94_PHAPC|nr:hypothetical protein PPACK8108_LOCUS19741 [Phakopsora pachyrhizi]
MPKVPKSNRTLNRWGSSHISPSNDSFCVYIRDFTKMIMGLTKNNKNLPFPPSSDKVERANLLNITDVDINSLIIDESNISVDEASITKEIPTKFEILCLSELAKNNINLATFQWDVKGQTKLDGLVINVVVKHWLHAKNNQTFEEYPLQQEYCTNTIDPPEPIGVKDHEEFDYLVEWKSYLNTMDETSWEPAENLDNTQEVVRDFCKLYPNKSRPGK